MSFIETWIKAAKFNLKILTRSEDVGKMQTEFPQVKCTESYFCKCHAIFASFLQKLHRFV